MNLALSDEQVFLREAARGALSRFKTLEAARALDTPQGGTPHEGAQASGSDSALPDLWPAACEAGWPGLLIDEAHGGAGLDAFDAMLVLGECGRVLAPVALLGHLPATAILGASPSAAGLLEPLATGARRAAYLPAMPPNDLVDGWCVDPKHGSARASAPKAKDDGKGGTLVSGTLAFVPDAPGADLLVGVALLDTPQGGTGGKPVGVAIESSANGVSVEEVHRYDATRSLGHVTLSGAQATLLDAPEEALAGAWHLTQALIAAESLGSVETALEMSVAYAKERHTFGRAIGSYQAVKHSLTEVLRQLGERTLAALLRRLVAPGRTCRVPAGGERCPLGCRACARPGSAHNDLRARRYRRHLGARRAAVLPPRAALATPSWRHRRGYRQGRGRADRTSRGGLTD